MGGWSRVLRSGLSAVVCLLALATGAATVAAAEVRASVVSLALWSGASVFPSEANGAAQVLADRYGHGGPVIVRANSGKALAAGPKPMVRALKAAETGMDVDRDVLFLVLTSHGSRDGIAERGNGMVGILTPKALGQALKQSRFRLKVVIVSACFAGVFLPLADPNTLVITAADARHPSFGCEEGRRWTYFGDAFFNEALRRPGALPERFADAKAVIRRRELAQGFKPSNPQIAGGQAVLSALGDR